MGDEKKKENVPEYKTLTEEIVDSQVTIQRHLQHQTSRRLLTESGMQACGRSSEA